MIEKIHEIGIGLTNVNAIRREYLELTREDARLKKYRDKNKDRDEDTRRHSTGSSWERINSQQFPHNFDAFA